MPLQLCAVGGYQLRLGVLGVPLIMVPDNKGLSKMMFRLPSQLKNCTSSTIWYKAEKILAFLDCLNNMHGGYLHFTPY
jgi:hypothetical protein